VAPVPVGVGSRVAVPEVGLGLHDAAGGADTAKSGHNHAADQLPGDCLGAATKEGEWQRASDQISIPPHKRGVRIASPSLIPGSEAWQCLDPAPSKPGKTPKMTLRSHIPADQARNRGGHR